MGVIIVATSGEGVGFAASKGLSAGELCYVGDGRPYRMPFSFLRSPSGDGKLTTDFVSNGLWSNVVTGNFGRLVSLYHHQLDCD